MGKIPSFRDIETLINVDDHMIEVANDLLRLPVYLLGKDQEVWNSWDRKRSEAEFRVTVALALAALYVVVALHVSSSWLFGLTSSVVLFILGLRKSRESHSILVDFAISRRVQLSVLESLHGPLDVHWKTEAQREEEKIELRRQMDEIDAIMAEKGYRVEEFDESAHQAPPGP